MNYPVAFLVYTDAMSIRRFIRVAAALAAASVACTFVCLTPRSRKLVERLLVEAKAPPTIRCHDGVYPPWQRAYQWAAAAVRPRPEVFNGAHHTISSQPCSSHEVDALAQKFDIDLDRLIDAYTRHRLPRWQAHLRHVDRWLSRIQPSAMVYDVELVEQIRTALFQCRHRGIPIISMQHAEGFGPQYRHLPLLADHYIAYSPFNAAVLREMNVPESRIHLTGNPDSDRLHGLDRAYIRNRVEALLGVRLEGTIVLAALRPEYDAPSRRMNVELIRDLSNVFGGVARTWVLIKPHNSDHAVGITHRKPLGHGSNLCWMPADYPIADLLGISRVLVTFMSSCIVEAVVLGVDAVVIHTDDGGRWPPWNTYGVYASISPQEVGSICRMILSGRMMLRIAEENRDRFVRDFRYRVDGLSANRVAHAIRRIATAGRS